MPDTTIGQKLPQFSKLFRLALLIGLIVAAILPALAGAQVPSEVLLRVYYIGVRKGPNAVESGTAFTIDRNGTQYLITAQHVVTGFSKDNPLLVYRNTDWHKLNVKQLRCCQDSDTDLAIFQPKVPLPAAPGELEPDDRSPFVGQEIFFLGFPHGLHSYAPGRYDYPVPFVKHGVLSLIGVGPWYIDGFNNQGFSGGPVIYEDLNTHKWKVGAVVHGYEQEPGKIKVGKDFVDSQTLQNSGILLAYPIRQALKTIDEDRQATQ